MHNTNTPPPTPLHPQRKKAKESVSQYFVKRVLDVLHKSASHGIPCMDATYA